MKKIFGFVIASVMVISLVYAPVAFADVEKGKALFNKGKKEGKKIIITACKTCHRPGGDPAKFKPVGPGLKGAGKRYNRERLRIWLSPKNITLWGDAIDAKGKIIGVPEDKLLQDLLKRYKAAKKGKDMKKSQMVKNFMSKGKKPPKITLTDEEREHIIDYVMTL